ASRECQALTKRQAPVPSRKHFRRAYFRKEPCFMPPIIPSSQQFDQPTMGKLIDAEPVVQRYRELFALFDWTALEPAVKPTGPGRPAHPSSAYVKALLV